ncbi:PAS domain S-box protein [Algoriphagus formosus]|uniref:histidine kinase n=1 Tax=Algoriphagus formosus TaxID=2007308 RepID=A0A4R5UYH8_9BACT|nr:PAS domain S-box protein [Algoriphagus aquimaris]TDK44215.1 PAS domain S-box protein [Algoriphagus aquimaris]
MKKSSEENFPSFSIERYRVLVEEALDIIFETDNQGYYTFVNSAATNILGYSRSEFLNMHYTDLIPEDYKVYLREFYQNQVANKVESTYMEFPVFSKSGKIEWVGQRTRILFKNENFYKTISIARIRTERYNFESRLKQSEEKYRGILEKLEFGLLEVDLNERIQFVNDAMCRMTGFSREELMGQVASEFLATSETKKLLNEQHVLRAQNKVSAYEAQILKKNQEPFYTIISGAPTYDLNGKRNGSIGVHVDITDRRKNELELLRIRKELDRYTHALESLNQINSDFSIGPETQLKESFQFISEYFKLSFGFIAAFHQDGSTEFIEILNPEDTKKLSKTYPLDKTISGLAFVNEKLISISDTVGTIYEKLPSVQSLGLKASLAMPVYLNGKKYGSIFLGSYEKSKNFTPYDLELFRLFARYISYILTAQKNQNTLKNQTESLLKTNEKLKKRQQFLSAINRFVTKILDEENLFSLAWEIVENVIAEFDFVDCMIYVVDEEKQCLVQLAAKGPKDEGNRKIKNPIEIPFGKGIVGAVAKSGKAEIIEDTTRDSRYFQDVGGFRSEITVPIFYDNKVIGVIDSEHPEPNFFTQEHLETLSIIANLTASKLKGAQLKLQKEKSDKELIDREALLRTVIQTALDAVVTVNKEGLVTGWNPQAETIFGWKAEEVMGRPMTENIIPVNYREAHDNGMKNYLKTGHGPVLNQRFEITAMHKSGREFPIEIAIIPLKLGGKITFTAFIRDITLQKNAREELEKNLQKERDLSELKSRFVSMTSHEFRTPLTTIKQNVDLIDFVLEKKAPEIKPEFEKYFERISGEIGRVSALMNDMLLLGKIEAGKVEIRLHPISILNLSREIISKLSTGREDNRTIELNIKGLEREIQADKSLMDHILTNLLTNALKYSEGRPNPQLTINYENLFELQISVRDFGIGIPEKDQKELFSSFFRATNVKNIQGTGLGLSIVKEFVQMHKGEIWVESELNKGAEFIVKIPTLIL